MKLPQTGRFHLLFESENSPSSSNGKVTASDLFSIFSPTVSTESDNRRDTICLFGELLVDFKHICESERGHDAAREHTTDGLGDPLQTNSRLTPNVRPSTYRPAACPQFRYDDVITDNGHDSSTTSTPADTDASSHGEQPHHARHTSDNDPDDPSTANWFLPPDYVISQMSLPSWFPSRRLQWTDDFKKGIMEVYITNFHHLNIEQSIFLYRTLIRSAHHKSLLDTERVKYEGKKTFKSVFSLIPFTPPWLVALMECKVHKKSLFKEQLKLDVDALPKMRDLRGKASHVLAKTHGLLAAFQTTEPDFASATIDFLLAHVTATATLQQPLLPDASISSPQRRQNSTNNTQRPVRKPRLQSCNGSQDQEASRHDSPSLSPPHDRHSQSQSPERRSTLKRKSNNEVRTKATTAVQSSSSDDSDFMPHSSIPERQHPSNSHSVLTQPMDSSESPRRTSSRLKKRKELPKQDSSLPSEIVRHDHNPNKRHTSHTANQSAPDATISAKWQQQVSWSEPLVSSTPTNDVIPVQTYMDSVQIDAPQSQPTTSNSLTTSPKTYIPVINDVL